MTWSAAGSWATTPVSPLDKLDHGDLVYNVDFRCVYASVLANWMKIDPVKVLGQSFQQAKVFNAKVTV